MRFNKKYIKHDIVQCDPLPEQKDLENYYKNKYYQDGKGSYDLTYTEEELNHKIYESTLIIKSITNFINSHSIPQSKFLELGCGEGFLLNEAQKAGFKVQGVDHSEFGIKKWHPHLEKYFLQKNIYDFLNESIKHQELFDVCALKNVLEHVIDPSFLLNQIKKILPPDGKIIITIPNDYSRLQNKLLEYGYTIEEEWFCPPDHLYYFNTTNFPKFASDCGFEILDLYTSFPVDMFLFNKSSNYVGNREKGKDAHFARVKIDLLISEAGLDKSLNLYRCMAACGIGRALTTVLTLKK